MPDTLSTDAAELAEDARRLLLELDRDVAGADASSAECRPPLDVVETTASVDVVVDLPGVPAEAIRVAIRRNTVLVVGVKLAAPAMASGRFHLAERSYGRFARAVRLDGSFDATRARAVAGGGQLRVSLPRIADRRGRLMRLAVERA